MFNVFVHSNLTHYNKIGINLYIFVSWQKAIGPEHSGAKGLANCTFANCLLNSVGTFNPVRSITT